MAQTKTTNYKDTAQSKHELMSTEFASLKSERQPYEPTWEDVALHLDPLLFQLTAKEKAANKINSDVILDGSPANAADALPPGLQNLITPQNRPWFRYTLGAKDEFIGQDSKEWLFSETTETHVCIQKTNFYQKTPIFYESTTKTAIAAMMVEKDYKNVFRCRTFTTGTYWVSNNAQGIVDKFYWETVYTLRQIVEEFCTNPLTGEQDISSLSDELQKEWLGTGSKETKVDVLMVERPNPDFNPAFQKMDSKFKRYALCYMEKSQVGKPGGKFLKEEGLDRFNIFVHRWFRRDEENYGSKCPAFKSLPDIKGLYKEAELKMQGLELEVKPPMNAKGSRNTQDVFSVMPGFLNFTGEAPDGFKPTFETQINLANLVADMDRTTRIINESFYADIMKRLAYDTRRERATATEISQQKFEDMAALNVVNGAFEREFLGPFLEYVFFLRWEMGLVAPPPQEIVQMGTVDIQYLSILSQATKVGNISSKERYLGTIANLSDKKPEVWDLLNLDKYLRGLADDLSVDPGDLNAEEMVQQIRQRREEALQARAQMEQLQAAGKTAKDLSGADLGGDNALSRMVGKGAAA